MEEFIKMISGQKYNPMTEYLKTRREETRRKLSTISGEPDEKVREEILKHLLTIC